MAAVAARNRDREPLTVVAPQRYRFAGGSLLSPWPLTVLGPAACGGEEGPSCELAFEPLSIPRTAVWASATSGELAGRRARFLCLAESDGALHLRVGGIGRFAVAPGGGRITVDAERADAVALTSGLFGPAAALALARRDAFLLHASAVHLPGGGVVAFLGESGDGKSTLAALLDAVGLTRVADDQLLLATPTSPHVLVQFPQLKLSASEQAALATLPDRLRLAGVVRLRPMEAGGRVRSRPLAPAAALCELTRHTIATSLFPPDLLAAQLDFAADVACHVPAIELLVPRRLDVAAEVHVALEALTA